MVGGGISQLPTSFYLTGLSFGIIVNIIIIFLTFCSCYLYMQTKDLLHGLDSISQIGFKLLGRSSIFLMNTVIFILAVGSNIIYFRLFGVTFKNVVQELVEDPDPNAWYSKEMYYILIIAVINLTTIYFKEIKEMAFVSMTLFGAICIFSVFMVVYICI